LADVKLTDGARRVPEVILQLTREEREIVEAVEAGTLQSAPNRSAIMNAHREYAAATFRKGRRPPEEGAPPPEPE
jgi:hypothetical protein